VTSRAPYCVFYSLLRRAAASAKFRRVKLLAALLLCSFSLAAHADEGKSSPRAQEKMGHEARVYIVDKDAPSVDKTVRLERRANLPAFKADK
jgi:hypothetical protein